MDTSVGWHPAPGVLGVLRYWDGSQWTAWLRQGEHAEHTAAQPVG
jgi:hypothetical protein